MIDWTSWMDYGFMKMALAAILIITPLFGLMGTMIVNKKMAYFPLFVDLKNKNILIIGCGKVAFRKVVKLIPFEGKITIIAPKICQ